MAKPPPLELATRRHVTRAAVAGVVSAAAIPLIGADQAFGLQPLAPSQKPRRRKWHRCKVHRKHTCWHATTCRHRLHKRNDHNTGPHDNPPGAFPPSVYEPDGVPTADELHLASRFTYGMTPALYAEMQLCGGPMPWFAAQLRPTLIADGLADQMQSWWSSINMNAATLAQRSRDGIESTWVAMTNYQSWCLMRRIYSKRQVLEVVTEFFENHLHVPVHDDGVFGYRADYGKLIRSHALGRFDQMLLAAITHAAMGVSLDNSNSTKDAPNENLGRELLELHTVGRGNYTEDDVKNSARILTGYRVDLWRTWNAYYDPASHWTGPVSVMGFTAPNSAPDGRAVTEAYLAYLARHPATARRLAKKLALRFVSDAPSEALVGHLADVYLAHDTAIVPVLQALVSHPEFTAAQGQKVRTPTDDVVATYRALDVAVNAPVNASSPANQLAWQAANVGQTPFGWARPDGPPENGEAWSSASRLLASFDVHYSMSAGWWPKHAGYHSATDWVPLTGSQSMRFDALVDHLSRRLLCRAANHRVLDACCVATGLGPADSITIGDPLVMSGMAGLLATVLDSPEHMSR